MPARGQRPARAGFSRKPRSGTQVASRLWAMATSRAKRVAAGAAILLAAGTSIATSPACDDEISLHDTAHLDATQPSVSRTFRISAPGPTHPSVKLTAAGGSVRVALAPADAPPLGSETGEVSNVSDNAGSANVELGDCGGRPCPFYRIRITVERIAGDAVDVSWDTTVGWDSCEHTELEDGRVEIVRDDP